MEKPDILVADGEHPVGLGIIRSLGKKKLRVMVAGNHGKSPAFYSKYIAGFFSYPKGPQMHNALIRKIKKYRPKVFMPLFDSCVRTVYEHQKVYQKYTNLIPMISYKKFALLDTKSKFAEFALKNKIAIPLTYICETETDIVKASRNIGFPLIIKPHIGRGSNGVYLIKNERDLIIKSRNMKTRKTIQCFDASKIIVQEYISNDLYTFNVFVHNAKIIARHQIKTLETYPAVCGSPASCISVYDKKLDDTGFEVLDKIRLKNGVLNMQFLYDWKDKKYKLIEINPRIWSSIQNSIDSGVDFPYLLYLTAQGKKVSHIRNYKINLRTKNIINEFKGCFQKRGLRSFINILKIRNTSTEFDLRDIKPDLVHLMNEANSMVRNL